MPFLVVSVSRNDPAHAAGDEVCGQLVTVAVAGLTASVTAATAAIAIDPVVLDYAVRIVRATRSTRCTARFDSTCFLAYASSSFSPAASGFPTSTTASGLSVALLWAKGPNVSTRSCCIARAAIT